MECPICKGKLQEVIWDGEKTMVCPVCDSSFPSYWVKALKKFEQKIEEHKK
jgi:uncharacterized Zn finger protein (UPF0148 family)